MLCTQCGSPLDSDSVFCEECGAATKKPEPTAAKISAAPHVQTEYLTRTSHPAMPFLRRTDIDSRSQVPLLRVPIFLLELSRRKQQEESP